MITYFVRLFTCFTCLFSPIWHLFLAYLYHASPSICFFSFLLTCFFFLCMDKHGARIPQARVRFPKHEKKGQGCKQKDACPQKAMISRLRGLAPPEQFSLSLSLSLFSRACIRVPIHVPPFIFMLLAWATFLWYDNVCFTFPIPYWAIPLECWQCLIYFLALYDSIVHDACVYISACVYG